MALQSTEAPPARLIRVFEIPASPPWDQARAAALEALNNSPLPAGRGRTCVRRLRSWAPGRPGRFACAYVKADRGVAEERFSEIIDGESIEFVIRSTKLERERRRRLLIDVGLTLAAAASVLVGGVKALALRQERQDDLLGQIHQARSTLASQEAVARASRNSVLLTKAGLAGHTLGDVLRDYAWAARSKSASAQIHAVVWDAGALTVTSAGPLSPLSDPARPAQLKEAAESGETTWVVGPRPAEAVPESVRSRPSIVWLRPARTPPPPPPRKAANAGL